MKRQNWIGFALAMFVLGILGGVLLSLAGAPSLLVQVGVAIVWLGGAAFAVWQLARGT